MKKNTGLPPHHIVKICPDCETGDLIWFWDKTRELLSDERYCQKCKKWIIPLRKKAFI